MKESLYNTILNLDNGYRIIFNALSLKYLVAADKLLPDFQGNLSAVKDAHLAEQLQEIGAVVNDDTDEVSILRNLIREYDDNKESFHLHVNPTLDCNFRCHYCYEQHMAGSRMAPEIIDSTILLIRNIIANSPELKYFYLSFFGGEPLMSFSNVVKPLILALEKEAEARDVTSVLHFTSNGYLLNGQMFEFFNAHKASFQITLDGHRDFHNQVRTASSGDSYDRILSNIGRLASIKCNVLVRINYTEQNMLSIPAIIDDFRNLTDEQKQYITFDLQRVWQDCSDERKEEITSAITSYAEVIREAGYGASIHYVQDMVRNSCYGDKRNYALINYDGYVFRCTARDFIEKNRAGRLTADGRIEWYGNSLEKRLAAKFSRPVCHTCRIAPICGGGCCQAAVERPQSDSCMYGYTEEDMDKFVTDRFEYLCRINETRVK